MKSKNGSASPGMKVYFRKCAAAIKLSNGSGKRWLAATRYWRIAQLTLVYSGAEYELCGPGETITICDQHDSAAGRRVRSAREEAW